MFARRLDRGRDVKDQRMALPRHLQHQMVAMLAAVFVVDAHIDRVGAGRKVLRQPRGPDKRVYGPAYYAFEHGDALFIMLDNVEYFGADPTQPRSRGRYRGRIGERQLAFVANLLKETPPEKLIVVVMHIPLQTYLDPKSPAQNTADAAELLALLGDRPSVSFSGHTHMTEHHYLSRANAPDAAPPIITMS